MPYPLGPQFSPPPHPIHFYLPWNCHGLTNQSALSPQNAWSKSFPFTYFNLQWPSPPWSLVFWPLNCPKCVGWESEITENWWKQATMLSVGQWPVFKLYLSISHKQLYLLVPFEQWPQIISKYVYQNCRDKYGLKWIIDKGYKILFFWKLTNQTTCLAVINPFNVTVLSTMLREANKSTEWKIETELVLELVRMQWKYSMSEKWLKTHVKSLLQKAIQMHQTLSVKLLHVWEIRALWMMPFSNSSN